MQDRPHFPLRESADSSFRPENTTGLVPPDHTGGGAHVEDAPHALSYGFNLRIWGFLMLFTAITVAAAQFDFGFLNVVVAMTIATTKAGLVILYFMHLRYEKPLFKIIVFVAFFMLAIAIGFTFFDLAYRY